MLGVGIGTKSQKNQIKTLMCCAVRFEAKNTVVVAVVRSLIIFPENHDSVYYSLLFTDFFASLT